MPENNNNQCWQYWPFEVNQQDRDTYEKIDFLKQIYSDGFKSYRAIEGLDCYGANSESRSGLIIQRARKSRWELRLTEGEERKLTAFVTDLKIAGTALRGWLLMRTISNIIEDIDQYLIIPPGLDSSFKV